MFTESQTYFLSEKDSARELRCGDRVVSSPLCSCCLIVVRNEYNDVYAQHCGGSDLRNLDNFFIIILQLRLLW